MLFVVAAAGSAAVVAALTVDGVPASAAQSKPLGQFKHLVVIYEENHSFDNLYGNWGSVGGKHVEGRADADALHSTQVSQAGTPYACLMQNDVNLTSPPLSALSGCDPETVTFPDGVTSVSYNSHFANAPFGIGDYIAPTDVTCPPNDNASHPENGIDKNNPIPGSRPGGCTRDLVHRFYQEQYQLDGGQQNRYTTGSDAVGLTQGYYDSAELPIYQYLHANGAPHYVIADQFFQGSFGGSFLNHQYLIAAQPPLWSGVPLSQHALLDSNGFPNATYPLYKPTTTVRDGRAAQQCGQTTTVAGFACGNWAVNTVQPQYPPTQGTSANNTLPAIDDTNADLTIGDRMSDAGISWAWYAGGWDDAEAGNPDPSFQFHHQPFNYFQRYAPGTPDRAAHLKDETDFLADVAAGTLPKVSFVKPLGVENEHPGYASETEGSGHLVDLIKAVTSGPQAGNTLVLVTYDEFGGQWDHVPPPGLGTAGAHDQFGPGTRIPALLVSRSLTHSAVSHTVYDTTSIMATIEHQFGLAPVDPSAAGVVPRDRLVPDLTAAVAAGRPETP
jgi:phospholipase C